jgi:hypothetical protein
MIRDIQLSRNFWLREAPCWTLADEGNVDALQETVARVLQPIRNQFGPTYITSWMRWSADCERRTGAHAMGGTVDFVVPGKTLQAWEWGNTHLMPTGYIGRWIYEPKTDTQGEHIHMAPRRDMVALNGDGRIQSLKELPDGNTFVFREWDAGTYANPYQLPGITAYATAGIPWWLAAGILFGLFTFDISSQAAGGWDLRGTK